MVQAAGLSHMKYHNVDEITSPMETQKGVAIKIGTTVDMTQMLDVNVSGLNDPDMNFRAQTAEEISNATPVPFTWAWAVSNDGLIAYTFGPYFSSWYNRDPETGELVLSAGNLNQTNARVALAEKLDATLPGDTCTLQFRCTNEPYQGADQLRILGTFINTRIGGTVVYFDRTFGNAYTVGKSPLTFYVGWPPTFLLAWPPPAVVTPIFTVPGCAGYDRGLIYSNSVITRY